MQRNMLRRNQQMRGSEPPCLFIMHVESAHPSKR